MIYSELSDCHACPLCLHRKRVAMPVAAAPWANRVMAIGSFPTQVEDSKGLCFADPARARVMTGFLESGGLDPASVYKTYLIKCRPAENQWPEGHEAETCPIWLTYEMVVNKPLVVVAFGSRVAEHLIWKFEPNHFGKVCFTSNEQYRGYTNPVWQKIDEAGVPTVPPSRTWDDEWVNWRGPVIVPVYDPDEILVRGKRPEYRKKLSRQLRRLKQVTNILAGMPPLWSAALMRGHKESNDEE